MKTMTRSLLRMKWLVIGLLGVGSASHAQDYNYIWTGAVSEAFFTGGNWLGGSAPQSYSGFNTIHFPGDPALTNNPDMGTATLHNVYLFSFEQAGWTVGGTDDGHLQVRRGDLVIESHIFYDPGVVTFQKQITASGTRDGFDYGRYMIGEGHVLHLAGNYAHSVYMGLYDDTGGIGPAGTMVIDRMDTLNVGFGNANRFDVYAGTLLINAVMGASQFDAYDGAVVGGTGGLVTRNATSFHSGSTLAPGGDGTYGNEIATFSYETYFSGRDLNMNAGSTLALDFTTAASDALRFESIRGGSATTSFNIASGVTLSLTGSTGVERDYVIVESGDGLTGFSINGSFDTFLLNGELVDPETDDRLSITYNRSESIIVSIIPEPSTSVLLLLGAGLAWRRRVRGRRA